MQSNPNKPVQVVVTPSKFEVLGIYRLGNFNVEVVLDWERFGGSFYFAPDDKGPPRLRVGMDDDVFANVLGVLMHEATEFILSNRGARLDYDDGWGRDASQYRFFFDHPTFSYTLDQLAWFVLKVLPDLTTAYNSRPRQ